MHRKALFSLVAAVFLGLGPALAQTTGIVGTVIDQAGAVVPNAQVTIKSVATEVTQTTHTNDAGQFTFANVTPGSYVVKVEVRGFKTTESRVDAVVGQTSPLTITLELGRYAETVTVSAGGGGGGGAPRESERRIVTVHYATDRRPTGKTDPYSFFGSLRRDDTALSYGTCRVSIPKDHHKGELEEPSILRLEFRPDPAKHVVLLEVVPAAESAFFTRLRDEIGATKRREALVFVHGYRTAFEAAARRAAQLAYDLRFDGVPIMYSWASEDRVLNYTVDESNVQWTIPRLETFLQAVAERTGADRIHLIAHSMGNRALTTALQNLALRQQTQLKQRFREVILAAPDIDAGVFRDLAAKFTGVTGRTTLYVSSNDKALRASQKLSRYQRAGQAGGDLIITPGVDTIDVSSVDTSLLGHSYYGDNRSVISDILRLIRRDEPPQSRCGLIELQSAQGKYWQFRKDVAKQCKWAE